MKLARVQVFHNICDIMYKQAFFDTQVFEKIALKGIYEFLSDNTFIETHINPELHEPVPG